MKKLVLASESPRRHEILTMVGLSFRIAKSNISEKFNPRFSPRSQAEDLSRQKAEAVAVRYRNAVIIGADTIVSLDNELFGKPESSQIAKAMLTKLQGKTHRVITGFTILDTDLRKSVTKSVETKVTMKSMSKKEIEWYILTKEPMDKAGAYAIQGKGSVFIEKIDGDYFNVVGLPIASLLEELNKFEIRLY